MYPGSAKTEVNDGKVVASVAPSTHGILRPIAEPPRGRVVDHPAVAVRVRAHCACQGEDSIVRCPNGAWLRA